MAPSIAAPLQPLLLPLLLLALLAHSATADLTIQCGQGSFSFGGPLVVGESEDRLVKVADCSHEVSQALSELQQLVEARELNEICTQRWASRIRDYQDQHLSLDKLPREARRLFLGYGLVVSDLCRKQFVAKLAKDPLKILEQSDLEALDRLASDKGLVGSLISEPKHDYKDLTVPKVMVKLASIRAKSASSSSASRDKIYIQSGTNREIEQMKATCRRRLAPIYEPLVLPLITLAQAGFNFRGKPVARASDVNEAVYRWYRAAFICESLRDIVLVEGRADDQGPSAGSGDRVVRVLTREEAAAAAAWRLPPGGASSVEDQEEDFGLEQAVYGPQFSEGAPQMDGYPLKSLARAIDRWHVPSDKLGFELARKFLHLVKRTTSRRAVKLLGSVPFVKRLVRSGTSSGASSGAAADVEHAHGANLVLAINDYLHQVSTTTTRRGDGSSSSSFDGKGLVWKVAVGVGELIAVLIGAGLIAIFLVGIVAGALG